MVLLAWKVEALAIARITESEQADEHSRPRIGESLLKIMNVSIYVTDSLTGIKQCKHPP